MSVTSVFAAMFLVMVSMAFVFVMPVVTVVFPVAARFVVMDIPVNGALICHDFYRASVTVIPMVAAIIIAI